MEPEVEGCRRGGGGGTRGLTSAFACTGGSETVVVEEAEGATGWTFRAGESTTAVVEEGATGWTFRAGGGGGGWGSLPLLLGVTGLG